MYWENIARSMVERTNRDAQELDVPLFCLQAAHHRQWRNNKGIDKQLTHQLLTVPNPHRTGKLQGMLLVHADMVARLADVLAPHLAHSTTSATSSQTDQHQPLTSSTASYGPNGPVMASGLRVSHHSSTTQDPR